jgi:outer membrane receptor protein involved in Fe transport
VRYIMRKPDFEAFSGSITVTASHVNGSDSVGFAEDIVLNVPLAESLALRVSGTRFDYPGLTDYVNVYRRQNNIPVIGPGGIFSNDTEFRSVEDADDFDGWYGRAALLWKPSANFDVTLTYMHQSDDYGGRRAQTLGVDGSGRPYDDYESGSMILEPGSRTVDLLAAEVNVDLGFATLTSSTSWYDHHGNLVSDNTGFYAQNGWLFNFYYNYPRPLAEADRTYGYEAWVQEVRIVSKSEGPWHYVLGAFYSNEEQFGTQDSYLRGFKNWADAAGLGAFVISDNDYHYIRNEEFTEFAGYGELTYHVTDALSVTGGLRVFKIESDTHVFQTTGLYTFFNETSDSRGSDESTRVLFKGNIAWKFADNDLLYATVSQGYRRGGSNGTPTTGLFAESPAFLSYSSDRVTDYELGVKGRLGENITYNADIFYVDWKDPQFNTATTNWGFFAVANGKQATTKGIEAQVDGYSGNWHWGVGYTYTDATLEDDLFTADGLILINTAGATLPGAPKHMMNGVLEYNLPFEDGSSLFFHIDGYYQSSTLNTISSASSSLNSVCYAFDCNFPGPFNGLPRFYAKFDSFALFNASATYSKDRWMATVFLKNVFNEAGITGEYTQAYMGSDPVQNYAGNASKEIFALPRTLGMTVSYKF